jgi:hypothetical protein
VSSYDVLLEIAGRLSKKLRCTNELSAALLSGDDKMEDVRKLMPIHWDYPLLRPLGLLAHT